MNYNVVGLPHYVIWHIYEPSTEDLKHMAWMAEEERRKLEEKRLREFYDLIWETGFEDIRMDWSNERQAILKNLDHDAASDRRIEVDWSDPDAATNEDGDTQDGENKDDSSTPEEIPLDFDPDN